MTCWQILGISPTTHKRTIKVAYTSKLKLFNPERDPDGFKRLRKAYEEAISASRYLTNEKIAQLQEAEVAVEQAQIETQAEAETETKEPEDSQDSEETDKSNHTLSGPFYQRPAYTLVNTKKTKTDPLEHITTPNALHRAMAQLYMDVDQRHEQKKWVALFERPLAMGLDGYPAFEKTVVGFICQFNLLPASILQAFDALFHFSQEFVRFKNEPWYPQAKYLFHLLRTLTQRLPYPEVERLPPEPNRCLHHLGTRRMVEDQAIFQSQPAPVLEDTYRQRETPYKDTPLAAFIAQYYALEGDYQRALAFLNTDPQEADDEKTLAVLADCLYHTGQYQAALTAYQRMCPFYDERNQPVPDSITKGIALCLMALDHYEAALGILDSLVERQPHDYLLRIQLTLARKQRIHVLSSTDEGLQSLELAGILFDAGRYQDCLSLLKDKKACLEDNSNPLLAKCYAKLGDYQSAINEFLHIIATAQQRQENTVDLVADYLVTLGWNLDEQQRKAIWDFAQQELADIQSACEQNAEYAYALALLCYRSSPLETSAEEKAVFQKNAQTYINIAVALDPHNAIYHFLRTYVLYETFDNNLMEEVIKSGEIARTVSYTKYHINFYLAFAYYCTQKYARAADLLEFTLKLEPTEQDRFTLSEALVKSYTELGEDDKAIYWIADIYDGPHSDVIQCRSQVGVLVMGCLESGREMTDSVLDFQLRLVKEALESQDHYYIRLIENLKQSLDSLGDTHQVRRDHYQEKIDQLSEEFSVQKKALDDWLQKQLAEEEEEELRIAKLEGEATNGEH